MARKIVGDHRPNLPNLGVNLERAVVQAVLVEDDVNGTQIGYVAIVDRSAPGVFQLVAASGAKLSFEEAQRHWPSIDRKKYQR